ncbi:hypothetical protein [Streptomyces sp. KLOTTS4A1]|uniref:hypothetical protein n=1 Tax=Streptomyces sp. KLOTTS4A1 TaxID=3390996 RepID=UPI0039F61EBB
MEPEVPPTPESRPPAEEPSTTAPEPAAPEPERPGRRRGRTTALVLAAALLGLAGGTAYGYTVQADREPTPLPALAQSRLAYPDEASKEAKDAAGMSKTDKDLRNLLVSKPKGARVADHPVFQGGAMPQDGWMPVRAYLEEYKSPSSMLEDLTVRGIRRVAAADWDKGEYRTIAVRLVQFRPGAETGAIEHARGQLAYMPYDEGGAGSEGHALKGSAEGRAFIYPVERKPGYLPNYEARAIAYRGDVVVDIHIFDTKPIKLKEIRSLAEKQVGRL